MAICCILHSLKYNVFDCQHCHFRFDIFLWEHLWHATFCTGKKTDKTNFFFLVTWYSLTYTVTARLHLGCNYFSIWQLTVAHLVFSFGFSDSCAHPTFQGSELRPKGWAISFYFFKGYALFTMTLSHTGKPRRVIRAHPSPSLPHSSLNILLLTSLAIPASETLPCSSLVLGSYRQESRPV